MKPFIRWAGGKRQLLPILMNNVPKEFNTYYEPFVGAGALLFELRPSVAVINDVNKELINTYRIIKEQYDELVKLVHAFDLIYCTKWYYIVREIYQKKATNYDDESAAFFLWLMKRCFNGLYRVNKAGKFNAAFSKNLSITSSVDYDNLKEISEYLQSVEILNSDFMAIKDMIQPKDFVFLDPPYDGDKSFVSYTSAGFGKNDTERLKEFFDYATNIGCYVMMTNHPTDYIKNLFSDYSQEVVSVKRLINSNGSKRTGSEIIIKNF